MFLKGLAKRLGLSKIIINTKYWRNVRKFFPILNPIYNKNWISYKIINLPSLSSSSGHKIFLLQNLSILEPCPLSLCGLKSVLPSSDRSLPLKLCVKSLSPLVLWDVTVSVKEKKIYIYENDQLVWLLIRMKFLHVLLCQSHKYTKFWW